jgi:uncharacterized protein
MIDKYDAPMLFGNVGERRFHAMAKPTGSTCNLDYTYCYYLSKEQLLKAPPNGRMDDETLERFVEQYIEGVTGDAVVFPWQRGEPTLRGLDFFRKVVTLQKNTPSQVRRSKTICRPTGHYSPKNGASF